ncbi:UDP-2,3-diacylglucosamine diphosphatase [Cupriavidus sp. AU9028]|uniref:UDP-2,3-diacylglucosamine diphosphatase n=1 Tax=Cupriavidus sp. AU9028 TaxID=2871157 RepID=UPI00351D7494
MTPPPSPVPAPAVPAIAANAPAWFISDLHLTPGMPRTLEAFERTIEQARSQARTLFILGDFFEFWVGDEELDDPFAQRIAAQLASLMRSGVAVYLMHGNRDFLLGRRFARAAGATLLDDPTVVKCAGHRIVLTHGDMLCTGDVAYMRFRHWTRKRWVQRLFLALPLRWRIGIAQRLRADSEAGRASRQDNAERTVYADVEPAAVQALLQQTGTAEMVHGHTHRPARHDEAGGVRWVLTDWDLDCARPRAAVLQLDDRGFRLLPQGD